MEDKKVIQINPDAFKIHKKTQREKKPRPVINVISPSVLKNKLLKKIKDHKAAVAKAASAPLPIIATSNISSEFDDSMEYLNTLVHQAREQQRPPNLTLRNRPEQTPISLDQPIQLSQPISQPPIQLSQPISQPTIQLSQPTIQLSQPTIQLSQPTIQLSQPISQPTIQLSQPISQTYRVDQSVPYGCLKGGVKPTYREYSNPNVPQVVRQTGPKTIKRRYTVGHDKTRRVVSVLIKDKTARNQITDAITDLKRKNMTEVRSYLKDKGLIKAGSACPTNILRSLYEDAMLTGDITNSDTETLMHNFNSDGLEK